MAAGESIQNTDLKFLYIILKRTEDLCLAKISQKLMFTVTEIDVESGDEVGSYEDDYDIPDVQIQVRDFVRAEALALGGFKDMWESMGKHPKNQEAISTFQLPFKTMEDAVEGVSRSFGMAVCDGSN